MKLPKLFILTLLTSAWINTLVFSQEGYPVPVQTENMLFYFQRSHNKNTVIYELNKDEDGKVNQRKPIKAYWIRYEEGGTRKELSFLQQKAFGISSKILDKNNDKFVIQFNHFKTRDIYLIKLQNGKYKAYTNINGELSELLALYIKSVNNSLGIPLKVEYIEMKGLSPKDNKPCKEKIIF